MKPTGLRNTLLALCVTATCFATLVFHTSTAKASASRPAADITYVIENEDFNYCLGIGGGSTQVGAKTTIWGCNGHPDQSWVEHLVGVDFSGFYYTFTNKNSHLCLGIPGGSSQNSITPVQWTCNGHPDQLWYTEPADNSSHPTMKIINRNSTKCLGVAGGNVFQGATPVQWTCVNHNDQYWYLAGQ